MKFIDPIDVAFVVKYHKDLLKTYSTEDEKAMGWAINSQRVRFEILSKIDDLNNKSVLDVGCGTAKLYQYLIEKFPTMRYVGIDIIEEFLNCATKSIENKDQNKPT
jgi:trans-aconitate methyltransferase